MSIRLLADNNYQILKNTTRKDNQVSEKGAVYEIIFGLKNKPEPLKREKEILLNCNPIFDRLVLDIDSDNIETAYKDVKSINNELTEMGFNTNVFFSGGKGFHMDLRFNPIDLDVMEYFPSFLQYWHNKIPSVDTKLKDGVTRLFRLPFAKHKETGLYKIPVNLNDDLKTIMEEAKRKPNKQINYVLSDSDIVINHLNECYNQFKETEPQRITYYEDTSTQIEENLRKLDDNQIKDIVNLVSPVFPILDRTNSKNDGALCLGGYFSYHISKESADKICNGIIEKVGNLFKDSNHFKKTVLQNYNKSDNKQGLPSLIKKINKITDGFNVDDFIYNLNKICIGAIRLTDSYIQFEGHNYRKDGIYLIKRTRDEEGNIKQQYIFKGNMLIKSFKITHDNTSYEGKRLFAPVVSLKYIDTAINVEKEIIREPFSTVVKKIQEEQMIKTDDKGLKALLRNLYIDGVNSNNGIVTAETDLLKDGFFYDDRSNKVISNNVFNDFNSTDDDVRDAISLFNEILSTRGTAIPNDCTLFRFMLWNPFGACLKQLGFTDDLYSLVLWGVTNTSKTGTSIIYSHLYSDKKTTLQKANSQSAIGSRLGENTFPLILDESKDNLTNPNDEEFNKNIVTDIIGRSVKDRSDNTLMVDFPALRMTIRTLNDDLRNQYKAEFYKRHKVLYYDKSMQITEQEKREFNKKYRPNNPNTVFKKFKHIGKAFADRFIPYIESQSEELYDLEGLTIKVLEQIEKDYNTQFNLNVKLKQDLTNQNADESSIIKNGLTALFHKKHKLEAGKTGYGKTDFEHIAKNGEITWLDYKPRKNVFAIKVSEFEQDVSAIIKQHIPILEVLKLLDIQGVEIIKGKFKGSAVQIVELNTFDLTYKLFGINIYSKEDWEAFENKTDTDKLIELTTQRNKLDKEIRKLEKQIKLEEAKKKQREDEFNRIINAKPI